VPQSDPRKFSGLLHDRRVVRLLPDRWVVEKRPLANDHVLAVSGRGEAEYGPGWAPTHPTGLEPPLR
jgi:hypothetical protein